MPRPGRVPAVDLVRGVVMVVMALDHVRDHLSAARFDPTDLARTTPALFLTRWVTHLCAPTFVLLAGTAAAFAASRRPSRRAMARFLVTRGLWLVVLELTVVRLAWCFNLDYAHVVVAGVIWAIGWSMVVLAGLVWLPWAAVAAVAAATIAGHDLLDGIRPEAFGGHGPLAWGVLGWLWIALHVSVPPIIYPLIPWPGVMAAGWCLARVYGWDAARRARWLTRAGTAAVVAFGGLRAWNGYGDPRPWSVQPRGPAYTVLSFFDVSKYPPSLDYLLVTLGLALLALAAAERARGRLADALVTIGRVPLFYYVVHLYVIHAITVAYAALAGRDVGDFLTIFAFFPRDFGVSLPAVYAIWVVVVVALYPACRWFARVKARRTDWWLAYV